MTGEILRPHGSWCDVAALPSGEVVWLYTASAAVVCERADGTERWRIDTGESLLFLRAAADDAGRICAIGQRHGDGRAAIVIDGQALISLGRTHGVNPVAIRGQYAGWTVYVQRSPTTYDEIRVQPSGDAVAMTRTMPATSQGFLELRGLQPITCDAGRFERGLVLPNRAGEVWVGQHPQDPPTLALVDERTGEIVRLNTGAAQPPHIAQRGDTYYVCAYKTPGGAWLGAYQRPFAAAAPAPVPAPPEERDEMQKPGVTIESFDRELRSGQRWSMRAVDRHNPGVIVETELVPKGEGRWSVHQRFINPSGSDRSGSDRIVEVRR